MCEGSGICRKILPRPATMRFEERGHFRMSLLHKITTMTTRRWDDPAGVWDGDNIVRNKNMFVVSDDINWIESLYWYH